MRAFDTPTGIRAGVGIGVDMVDTRELADMIEASGPSFMDLCWTPAEQAYCTESVPRLAARWAAKEATMKALGRGIGEVDPIDIEVVSAEGEPPSLQLHGSAAALARELQIDHVALSLTHEADFVVAFVVVIDDGFNLDTSCRGGRHGRESRYGARSRAINDGVSIAEQKGQAH